MATKCEIDKNCTFEKISFKTLNVLLIGQANCGKSTIIRTISEDHSTASARGFNESREATLKTSFLYSKKFNACYKFNFIDTVGIETNRASGLDYDIDRELLTVARLCVASNISTLHAVCFISTAGQTDTVDADLFNKVRCYLGSNLSQISMMILTHCNIFDDETLQKFEKEIKDNMKETYEYCKLGMYYHGLSDLNEAKSVSKPSPLQAKMDRLTHKLIHCFTTLVDKECPIPLRIFAITETAKKALDDAMNQSLTTYHEENKRIVNKSLKAQQIEEEQRSLEENKRKCEIEIDQIQIKLKALSSNDNSPQPENNQNRKDPDPKIAGFNKKKDQQPKPKPSTGGKAEALKMQLEEEQKRLREITSEIKKRNEAQFNLERSKTSYVFGNNECSMM